MNTHAHPLLLCLILLLAITGCLRESQSANTNAGASVDTQSTTLTVFAAASLADAFQEIAHSFESIHPHVDVALNFAGSQQLTQQILFGAKADVFAPAHLSKINSVAAQNLIIPESHHFFASNHLVVITPKENPAGFSSFVELSNPGLKLIMAAAEVPVGQYTRLMLQNTKHDTAYPPNFQQAVLNQTVSFEQSVRAIRTKIRLGEADAGIVYSSDVSDSSNDVTKLEIPRAINITTRYPISTLRDSQEPELAHAFVRYVLSDNGQQILARHGFVSV